MSICLQLPRTDIAHLAQTKTRWLDSTSGGFMLPDVLENSGTGRTSTWSLDRPQRRRCLKKICSATCTDARILFVWTAWAPVPTEPVSDMHVRRLVGIPLFVTEAGWDRIFYSSGIGSPTCLGARNFELGTAPCNAMIRCLETLSLLSAPAISYVVAVSDHFRLDSFCDCFLCLGVCV
jgi:hypothetical protein